MVSMSTQTSTGFAGQMIARIVGFTCLFGFLADMIALTFPPGGGGGLAGGPVAANGRSQHCVAVWFGPSDL